MSIHTLTTGQLRTKTYLICKANSDCLIIDPGDNADLISDEISKQDLKPKAIIATHGHFDHVMAAWELQQNYKIPFYLHQKDQFLLDRLSTTVKHFIGNNVEAIPPDEITNIDSNDFKDLEKEFNFSTILSPGHTPGSISLFFEKSYLIPRQSHLFAGDLIFYGGIRGRTDFAYASEKKIFKSIEKVLELPPETIVHPGHGQETTIEFEKKIWEL